MNQRERNFPSGRLSRNREEGTSSRPSDRATERTSERSKRFVCGRGEQLNASDRSVSESVGGRFCFFRSWSQNRTKERRTDERAIGRNEGTKEGRGNGGTGERTDGRSSERASERATGPFPISSRLRVLLFDSVGEFLEELFLFVVEAFRSISVTN